MILGTLEASLLGDLLTKNSSEKGTVKAGEGVQKKLKFQGILHHIL